MSVSKHRAIVALVLSLGLILAAPSTARSAHGDAHHRAESAYEMQAGGAGQQESGLLELLGSWWSQLWVASRSTVGGDG